jgi:hypothetical protein
MMHLPWARMSKDRFGMIHDGVAYRVERLPNGVRWGLYRQNVIKGGPFAPIMVFCMGPSPKHKSWSPLVWWSPLPLMKIAQLYVANPERMHWGGSPDEGKWFDYTSHLEVDAFGNYLPVAANLLPLEEASQGGENE